ncbi:MAG: electron transport complex subunit E [Eubacterium sp.]|nr:electron transport complex subunit E [Eubacterium sp.]
MKLKKNSPVERLWNGIFVENPVFVLVLGTCPTLATTTSAINAIGMGLSTTVILALSNLIISALRKIIPDRMRMPAYIVVIASFVTMVDFLMEGFTPALYASLGIYIPLIVVNCIIMGRAEAYAGKEPVIPSFFDGLGMGIGFTIAIFFIASIREIIGAGTWFGIQVMPSGYVPVNIFVLAPGAFLVYAFLVAVMNKLKIGAGRKPKKEWDPTEKICGDCLSCMKLGICDEKPETCSESPAQTIARTKGTVEEAVAGSAGAQSSAAEGAVSEKKEETKS